MATIVDKFTEITKRSLKDFVNERITDRLKSAIDLPENSSDITTSEDTKNIESGTNNFPKEDYRSYNYARRTRSFLSC